MRKIMFVFVFLISFSITLYIGLLLINKNSTTRSFSQTNSVSVDLVTENPKDISSAHNAFGFNLFKLINKEAKNGNFFISPSSIALALSMVYGGAQGQTQLEMQKALQFQNLSLAEINQKSLELINTLEKTDSKLEVSIADSVWINRGIVVKPDFLNVVKNYYKAEISNLDFLDPYSVGVINDWVNTNTRGKIPTIINKIPPGVMMYLINAIYFKGDWEYPFEKSNTKDKDFTSFDGVTKKYPLMEQYDDFNYFENKDLQSIILPYKGNSGLSMYVFLPKDINKFIADFNAVNWGKWISKYDLRPGTIILPKFKMEYETELKDVLVQLGISSAFTDSADFSGISNTELAISRVIHKTYIDVYEEGTEAAAVTAVEMMATGLSMNPPKPPKPFYMEVNHPFVYAIVDNKTKEMLFVGVVKELK